MFGQPYQPYFWLGIRKFVIYPLSQTRPRKPGKHHVAPLEVDAEQRAAA